MATEQACPALSSASSVGFPIGANRNGAGRPIGPSFPATVPGGSAILSSLMRIPGGSIS
jgi:hypothetical protein